jgi:hypothetical protein
VELIGMVTFVIGMIIGFLRCFTDRKDMKPAVPCQLAVVDGAAPRDRTDDGRSRLPTTAHTDEVMAVKAWRDQAAWTWNALGSGENRGKRLMPPGSAKCPY